MKLKKAIREAKKLKKSGLIDAEFVAVDQDKSIYCYGKKPNPAITTGMWAMNHGIILQIGFYTGSKPWRETLRTVE